MTVPARAENVPMVRHSVAGFAEQLGMEAERVGDLKTVVSEACINVVQHAYESVAGPLDILAEAEAGEVTVTVSDFGRGITPRADLEQPSLQLGLTLIAALSASFEISGGKGSGTRVKVRLPLGADRAEPDAEPVLEPEGAEIEVDAPDLIGPILGRVFGAVAARQEMSIDRLSDGMLLTDAISAEGAGAFANKHFRLVVTDGDGGVDLNIGPMSEGAGSRLRDRLRLPGENGSLESLADAVGVDNRPDGEYLTVRFDAPGSS